MYNFALEQAKAVINSVLYENGKTSHMQAKGFLWVKEYVHIEFTSAQNRYIILSKKFVNDIDEKLMEDEGILTLTVEDYVAMLEEISDENEAIQKEINEKALLARGTPWYA